MPGGSAACPAAGGYSWGWWPVDTDAMWVSQGVTLRQAGHRMRELGVMALRVRDADGTDRGTVSYDKIVSCIAAGSDPAMVTAGDLARPPALTGAAWWQWPAGGHARYAA